jgi:hypothetical protein
MRNPERIGGLNRRAPSGNSAAAAGRFTVLSS